MRRDWALWFVLVLSLLLVCSGEAEEMRVRDPMGTDSRPASKAVETQGAGPVSESDSDASAVPPVRLFAPSARSEVAVSPSIAPSETQSTTVLLKPEVDLTVAAKSLAMAVRSYEASEGQVLPDSWTAATLERGKNRVLGPGLFLLLVEPVEPGVARLLFVDNDGPHKASLGVGQEAVMGSLRAILLSQRPDGRSAVVLYRAARSVPLLLSSDGVDGVVGVAATGDAALSAQATGRGPEVSRQTSSKARFQALEHPKRIVIESSSARTTNFAMGFLQGINSGLSPEDAARSARAMAPPRRPNGPAGNGTSQTGFSPPAGSPGSGRATANDGNLTGSANSGAAAPPPVALLPFGVDVASDTPLSARVTLDLVRGEASELKALSGAMEYRAGNSGGPEAKRKDSRFQASLQALAETKKVHVETSLFLDVPLGGRSKLSLSGPAGAATAWIHVIPRGRDAVELDIDQRGGDWTFLGVVSTSVIVRNGQTVLLARNQVDRSAIKRSGLPVARDIPLVGPVFGTDQRVDERSTYALYATVNLE